jgi:hypothetical protein
MLLFLSSTRRALILILNYFKKREESRGERGWELFNDSIKLAYKNPTKPYKKPMPK